METKRLPEEDFTNPSQTELMRRGRVKAKDNVNMETRISNAVRCVNVWGWSKQEAYETAGIGKDRLNTALSDIVAGGTGIVKPGPKPLLTDEILQDVKNELTRKSMNFRSVRAQEGGEYSFDENDLCYDSKQTNKHDSQIA